MKGKFSTAIAEFSSLEKLDQNIKICTCISINLEFHITVKHTFASKMLFDCLNQIVMPGHKKYFMSYMDAKTLGNKHLYTIYLLVISHIYLTEGLYLLFRSERQAPCLTLKESNTESVVHVEVYRITLLSLNSKKV